MQISQEAGQVVWYSHLLKIFPQFVVIHTVKGFGVVNKAAADACLDWGRGWTQCPLISLLLLPLAQREDYTGETEAKES